MPEYIAPGVYVEEIGWGPRPIEDVSTSIAGMVGETERGPLGPRLVTSWADYTRCYGGYIDAFVPPPTQNIYLPYAVRGFFENGGRRLYVARVAGAGSKTAQGIIPGVSGDTTVEAIGPGSWGNRVVVSVTRSLPQPDRYRIQVTYCRGGEPDELEVFDDLSADSTLPNHAATVVNKSSKLIRIIHCPSTVSEAPLPGIALQGGSTQPAASAEYLNDGLAALSGIDDVSLMAIPDEVRLKTLGAALVEKCESLKDRFAVLNELDDQRDATQVRPARDSSYGAIYYPKLRVPAPHAPEGHILVPPCGHILGLIARVELGRGVAKAPANEVVRGLVEENPLQFATGKSEQDSLNSRGVNVVRDFRSSGRGVRVWGARTMSSDPQWRYINVRRLCIFLERSIQRGTQWVVFEPNSERTWSAVRASVSSFLGMVWRDGALLGSRESDAFLVKCDRTTMTQDDLDDGRLICLIGVAPVKPAEFVIIRISQKMAAPNSRKA